MINVLQTNHKVAKAQQLLPRSTSTRQKMNYRAPRHLTKNVGEEDRVTLKHDDSDSIIDNTKTKRTFKNSVIRSLRSDRVLVPNSLDEMTIGTNNNAKKSTADRVSQYVRPLRCNYGNQRYISQASKNVDQKNKRIRKRNVIGSLRSILGPEEVNGKSNLQGEQPDTSLTSGKIVFPEKRNSLERPLDLQKEAIMSISKPLSFSKRWESRKLKNKNQEQESSTLSNGLDQSKAKRKPKSATIDSVKSKAEKDKKQTVKEKVRVMRNPKSRQFDETKLREEIRSRLQKNIEKYEALAASLDSKEGDAASNEASSTLATSSIQAQEGKKAFVTGLQATPTMRTKSGRRGKRKTKMVRSHTVRSRIPLTIQEDSVLGEAGNSQSKAKSDSAQNKRRFPEREKRRSQVGKKSTTKAKAPQSPKKAKASFYPRSPKHSPSRNRRRFRVAVPHPTECAGSRATNHGGLCMTFPTRTQIGERRKEDSERRISVERIQGLMLIQ